MDRISKLPIGVIETILCLLPIQEAARTSILSREWRYHWTKIPKLVFIENQFQVFTDGSELSVLERTFDKPSKRKKMAKRCKFFYAIYQVLIMHDGPIHEFTLSKRRVDGSCVEIDQILVHLSRKNTVKILKLDFFGQYKLPISFFSLHQLTDLYLAECVIDHQPAFNAFGSLTTLYLRDIYIHVKELMRLLSSCPLLKRLAILSDAGTINGIGDITIADFIKCLPGIEYLSLSCLIFLCFPPLPKELPTMVHLKCLCMEWVWFRHKYVVPFLVLLIRSCPNLQKLKLEIYVDDYLFEESETGYFPREDYPDIMLEHLTELEILQFSDADNELDFVKFILAKSRVLKKARILLWDQIDKDKKLQISKTILSSPCASPAVKLNVI